MDATANFSLSFAPASTRPRQREALIEFLREGKVDEAVRAFKKIYLEVVYQIIDNLQSQAAANSWDRGR